MGNTIIVFVNALFVLTEDEIDPPYEYTFIHDKKKGKWECIAQDDVDSDTGEFLSTSRTFSAKDCEIPPPREGWDKKDFESDHGCKILDALDQLNRLWGMERDRDEVFSF